MIRRYSIRKLLFASSLCTLFSGGLVGMLIGTGVFQNVLQDNIELTDQVKQLYMIQRNNQLKIAELTTFHNLDKQSLLDVSKTVVELESNLADAEIEIQLYQTLMGEYRETDKPFVRKVQLFNAENGEIAYRIIVQQGRTLQGKTRKIKLQVTINGADGKGLVNYPLAAIDPLFPSSEVSFSIKYFKLFEGQLILPQGFKPDEITTRVDVSGKKKVSREQKFMWHVQSTPE